MRKIRYLVDDKKVLDAVAIRQHNIADLFYRIWQDGLYFLRQYAGVDLVAVEPGKLGIVVFKLVRVDIYLTDVLELLFCVQLAIKSVITFNSQ